jgi:hypothetical protein
MIPVAILSTDEFDAPEMVDIDSLTFGRTGDEPSLVFCSGAEDVNGDGLQDVVCHFYTDDIGFQWGDTEGVLKGMTKDGMPIQGSDSVRINPCKKWASHLFGHWGQSQFGSAFFVRISPRNR